MNYSNLHIMKHLTITLCLTLLLLPVISLAKEYSPLVGLPGVDPNAPSFDEYINSLYALSISIAALLAVIKIIIAGVKWMLTDIVPSKSEAKKDIQGALIGLLVILGAVLVLTVINPNLVEVDLQMTKVQTKAYSAPGTVTLDTSQVTPYAHSDGLSITASSEQREAFEASCIPPKTFKLNAYSNEIRCFDTTANETVMYTGFACKGDSPAALTACSKQKQFLVDSCENDGGEYYDEPESKTGYFNYSCIKPK